MLYFIFAGELVVASTGFFTLGFGKGTGVDTETYFLFWYVNIIVYISVEKLILKQPI